MSIAYATIIAAAHTTCTTSSSTTLAFSAPDGCSTSLIFPPSHLLVRRRNIPAPIHTRNFSTRRMVMNDDDNVDGTVAEQVKSSRYFRHVGILVGSSLFLISALLGSLIGIVDPASVLLLGIGAATFFCANAQRYNEESEPLPDSSFEVRESTIPNAGMGLFAGETLPPNRYLFAYEGERLSNEDAYFARYPDGQGRYVAVIDEQFPLLPLVSLIPDEMSESRDILRRLSEPTYIDGIHPSKSNLARYMNSNSIDPNIRWTKQRFGKQAGTMHFYTMDRVDVGDEILFDYGSNYWDAVQE